MKFGERQPQTSLRYKVTFENILFVLLGCFFLFSTFSREGHHWPLSPLQEISKKSIFQAYPDPSKDWSVFSLPYFPGIVGVAKLVRAFNFDDQKMGTVLIFLGVLGVLALILILQKLSSAWSGRPQVGFLFLATFFCFYVQDWVVSTSSFRPDALVLILAIVSFITLDKIKKSMASKTAVGILFLAVFMGTLLKQHFLAYLLGFLCVAAFDKDLGYKKKVALSLALALPSFLAVLFFCFNGKKKVKKKKWPWTGSYLLSLGWASI